MSDKRKVATDALETLGTIIDHTAKRDAIHLAVEPVIAQEDLMPGDDVGADGTTLNPVGIVDPFLTDKVLKGERFWLVVYPRQIDSLRHVWTHPAFKDEPVLGPVSPQEQLHIDSVLDVLDGSHRIWIEQFAASINQSFDSLMEAAEDWLNNKEYTSDNTESYKDRWNDFPDFWEHYEKMTGKAVLPQDRDSFFTCSC